MSAPTLRIAEGLRLPLDAVTKTHGILAKRRVGKTYTASVMAEEFAKASLPFVALDPTGAWWGLRSSADGKAPGIPAVIIGGEHGDLPLEPTAGKVLADLVVEHPGWYVLDLSGTASNAEQDRFATDFAERLYRRKARERAPLHLFIDEADSFIPQRPVPGQQRMLGAFEAVVRRGGIRGIGTTLISQRAAVVNKNVLEQLDVLIALQITGPNDRAAVDAWVKGHATAEQRQVFVDSLASLGRGEAWYWEPGRDLFKRIRVRARDTFNSSATPEAGHRAAEPARLAPVDLEALRGRIAATVEKAKADDPRELRRRIAELEREARSRSAAAATAAKPERVVEKVEVPMLKDAQLGRLEKVVGRLEQFGERTVAVGQDVVTVGREITAALTKLRQPTNGHRPAPALRPSARTAVSVAPPLAVMRPMRHVQRADAGSAGGEGPVRVRAGARRMLEAVAGRYPAPTTVAQMGQLARVKRSGGTFSTYLSDLRKGGLLVEEGNRVELTNDGWAAVGLAPGAAAPQTTEDLLALYRGVLRGGARRMVRVLMEAYPEALSRENLSELAQVAQTGGTFSTYLGDLVNGGLVERVGGDVRASELLMNPAGAV